MREIKKTFERIEYVKMKTGEYEKTFYVSDDGIKHSESKNDIIMYEQHNKFKQIESKDIDLPFLVPYTWYKFKNEEEVNLFKIFRSLTGSSFSPDHSGFVNFNNENVYCDNLKLPIGEWVGLYWPEDSYVPDLYTFSYIKNSIQYMFE